MGLEGPNIPSKEVLGALGYFLEGGTGLSARRVQSYLRFGGTTGALG